MCTIKNCGNRVLARGYCSKHYKRWYKYGDPLVDRKPGAPKGNSNALKKQATYKAAHHRFFSTEGKASQYQCLKCSNTAYEWAYQHRCVEELQSEFGPYCLHNEHYEPMCRSCHKYLDLENCG